MLGAERAFGRRAFLKGATGLAGDLRSPAEMDVILAAIDDLESFGDIRDFTALL